MKSNRLAVGTATAAAMLLLIGTASPASAATPGFDPYSRKWAASSKMIIGVHQEIADVGATTYVNKAADTWNAARTKSAQPLFVKAPATPFDFDDTNINNGCAPRDGTKGKINVGIIYRPLGDAAGATRWCGSRPAIGAIVTLNTTAGRGSSWYKGTGTPGSTQMDMLSITTHELGHATGWLAEAEGLHTVDTWCPTDTTKRSSMCTDIKPGSSYARTLLDRASPAASDKRKFQDAY